MERRLLFILCFLVTIWFPGCNGNLAENGDSVKELNDNSQAIESATQNSIPRKKQIDFEKIKQKKETEFKMRDKANQHDGALLLSTIGDMDSVPALIEVLKNYPPGKNGTMICTTAHAIKALREITGNNSAITFDEWKSWYEIYKREQ